MSTTAAPPTTFDQNCLTVLECYAVRDAAAKVSHSDYSGWLDRILDVPGLETSSLTSIHGFLIAQGLIKFEFTESFMRIILVFENKSFAGRIFKSFVLFIFIYRLIELLYLSCVFNSAFSYLIVVVEALFVHSQLHGYVFVVYQNIVQRFEINVFFNFHVAMLVLVKLIWLIILRDFN